MDTFLKCRPNVRVGLLQNATHFFHGMRSPVLMEKDFWLCYLLECLFSIEECAEHFLLGGEASLAKSYQYLSRFVDVCEIAVEPSYVLERTTQDSTTRREIRETHDFTVNLPPLQHALQHKLETCIKPLLREQLAHRLSDYFPAEEWQLNVVPHEPLVLTFHYPKSSLSRLQDTLLAPLIKIEFNFIDGSVLCEKLAMTPYLYQATPELAKTIQPTPMNTVSVTRTFWKKIALLQREHARVAENPIPKNGSRHYYDVAQLDQHNVTVRACEYGQVELKKGGAFHLQPPDYFLRELQRDYQTMSHTYFGDVPEFATILQTLAQVEKNLNAFFK